MCRFIVHRIVDIDEFEKTLEDDLYNVAIEVLGASEGDVEVIWPEEKLGRGCPALTVDATFTVGEETGDIPNDKKLFEAFADSVLSSLLILAPFLFDKADGGMLRRLKVATWVIPIGANTSVWRERTIIN